MKTQEEILARIEVIKASGKDWMEEEQASLISFLDFKNAKSFLKADVTEESWQETLSGNKTPKQEIIDYMAFAWEKANNCRGLSASRSLDHMRAWLWLDNQEEFLEKHNWLYEYRFYGKEQLIAICELYELNWKQWDDGMRSNDGVEFHKAGEREITDLEIIEAMSLYGGSFVKALAECFRRADTMNYGKLKDAFQNYWAEYEGIVRTNLTAPKNES